MSASAAPRRQYSDALRNAVDGLRNDGWDVEVEPQSVPPQLAGYRPDYLARKGSMLIVGEIKYRGEKDSDSLSGLAELVATIPDARLQMTWLGRVREDPAPERVLQMASEARVIAATSQDAALLLAWAALEGGLEILLSRVTNTDEASGKTVTLRQRLNLLNTLGEISESQFDRLMSASDARNRLAHARGPVSSDSFTIEYVIATAIAIARGAFSSVESMVEWFLMTYEDPAEHVPYESRDGGYIYYAGGPYSALDALAENFDLMPDIDIADAAGVVEADGTHEWVRKADY